MGRRAAAGAWLGVAATLWVAVALDCGVRAPADPVARRLVAGLAAANVETIELGAVVLRRDPAGRFAAGALPADARAVEAVLAVVEHSWVRRFRAGAGESAELGLARPRARLALTTSRGTVRLGLGDAVAAGELVWVGVGEDAGLITATEAAQLFPPPRELLERRPFRVAATDVAALGISSGEGAVEVGGAPLAVSIAGGHARVDLAALERLLAELRGLELAPFEPAAGAVVGLSIRIASARGVELLEIVGSCSGGVGVETHLGRGCVAADPLDRARAIAESAERLVERRLVDPGRRAVAAVIERGPIRFEIAGGVAARELLARLAAGSAEAAVAGAGPPDARVEIRYATGAADRIELERRGDRWWARRAGEPIGWILEPGSDALVVADPVEFRDRRVWARDPTELRRASRRTRRSVTVIERGDALDRWRAALPEPGEAAGGPALVAAVALLEAERFVAAAALPEHGLSPPRATITLDFDPPPVDTGEPDRRQLAVGAALDGGACYARADADPAVFVLDAETCAALTEPW